MSSNPKGSSTNVDIDLDQKFDIDYKTDRKKTDTEVEQTYTNTNNHNYNLSVEKEITHTTGKKLALELEVEKTTTDNYNKNVDIDIDKSEYSETVLIDVEKKVKEKIDVDINDTSNWNVYVNVHSDNIIQNSHVQSDVDANDLDTSGLINVASSGELTMDDFNLDITSIGGSFNGAGNDGQINVNQANNLVDNDQVHGTTTGYANNQAPNVDGTLDADAYYESSHEAASGFQAWYKDDGKDGKPGHYDPKGMPGRDGGSQGSVSGHSWYSAEAAAGGSLAIDLTLSAPTAAFETVTAEGGESTAGDGIGHAHLNNTNSDNERDGDGVVSGEALATANAAASAEAFSNDIMAGGNQQANFATVNLVGGDKLNGGDIKGHYSNSGGDNDPQPAKDGLAIKDSHVTLDDDINDLDTSNLINVSGMLEMDDFNLDMDAIGDSFNGSGNDYALDVSQANDLVDNDMVTGTSTSYMGQGWNAPFQSVTATGGMAEAGNGIGHIGGHGVANSNGGDGAILGSTTAMANADASAIAFTNAIVVGANLQVNNFSATIVGGDSAIVDDIGGY